ncbi:unnamed protein product, partial [Adineta steineri]
MAAKRVTAYDASPKCKSDSENEYNIRQSTRPRTQSLITIISFTMWIISIKKAKTTINKTTATIDTSATKTKMPTTSITETTVLTTSTNSRATKMNVSKFNKWKQNAITAAGGYGKGQKLNQLAHPYGIFIDKKKNIFIADLWNDRIVEWKYNAKQGKVIAGGNGKGNRMDRLNGPTDVIVDHQNHSIIIANSGNRRVIRWLNEKQQILIQNIQCWGLAIDKNGFLYVSDWEKHEVRRWKMGEYNNEGIIVAGGNGKGDQLHQLSYPT